MLGRLATHAAGRSTRLVPFLQLVAVVQIALLARRHVQHLDSAEAPAGSPGWPAGARACRPPSATSSGALAGKLDARAFVGGAADRISPVPLPRFMTKARY